ncbi:MAG: lysylphosphatidylglycerol synthase transmembrane domain-containing protein [Pseudomonadota bacterium]
MLAAASQRPGLLTTGLLLGLFVASLVAAVLATGWQETADALGRLSLWHAALLLVLSLGNYLARAARWHHLARSAGLPTGFSQNTRHYLGGFALTATPGRLGELVRLRWLGRETGWPIDRTAPLALADRASELAAVALLLALAVGLSALGLGFVWPLIALSLVLAWAASSPRFLYRAVTLCWRILGRWGRLFARLRRVAAGLAPFLRPRAGLPALALGALGWFFEGLAFYLLLDWLGAPLPLWTAVAIFLAAMISGALAGLPGGLGGAEAAMIAMLALADVPLEIALPATAIIRATTLWFAILIGLGIFPIAEARSRQNRPGDA